MTGVSYRHLRRTLVAVCLGSAAMLIAFKLNAQQAPTVDPDNCASIRAGIEYNNQQIRANADYRDAQQRFMESNRALQRLYDARCTGNGDQGGGYYQPSNTASSALGVGLQLFGMFMDRQARSERDDAARAEAEVEAAVAYGRELEREEQERYRAIRQREATCSPERGECEAKGENPFSLAFHDQELARCKSIWSADYRGRSIDRLPACPTRQEVASYCKVPYEGLTALQLETALVNNICVAELSKRTQPYCSLHEAKQARLYQLSLDCLDGEAARLSKRHG